jgi:hypothetical protein
MSRAGRLTSIHERVAPRLRAFSELMLPLLDGHDATSVRYDECPSLGISSSGSRAGLWSIECGGRSETSFAAKSIMNARVATARTRPKSSDSCETIYHCLTRLGQP